MSSDVPVGSLTSDAAACTTIDLQQLFGALESDAQGSVDGVADVDDMPLAAEPPPVQAEISDALRRLAG